MTRLRGTARLAGILLTAAVLALGAFLVSPVNVSAAGDPCTGWLILNNSVQSDEELFGMEIMWERESTDGSNWYAARVGHYSDWLIVVRQYDEHRASHMLLEREVSLYGDTAWAGTDDQGDYWVATEFGSDPSYDAERLLLVQRSMQAGCAS